MNNVRMGQLDAPGTVNSPLSGNFVAVQERKLSLLRSIPRLHHSNPRARHLEPQAQRARRRRRVPTHLPLVHQAQRQLFQHRRLQHLDPGLEPQPAIPTSEAYSDGFTVVGCTTANVDARDNTATTFTSSEKGVPIYWLGGNKVADEYRGFLRRAPGTTRRTTRTS